MTPDQVHYGQTDAVHAARQHTLDHAFRANPERFVNQPPIPPAKPTAAWINPPTPKGQSSGPTLAPSQDAPRCVPPHRVVPGNPSPRPPSALCLMGPPPLGSVMARDASLPTPPPQQPAIGQVMDEATAMPASQNQGGAVRSNPSLNAEPGCIKVVDTLRHAPGPARARPSGGARVRRS